MSSLKRQAPATSPAPTALGKSDPSTWTGNSSSPLFLSVASTGQDRSASTSSESRYCTQESLKQLNSSKRQIKKIRSFLRQMERSLTNSEILYAGWEWTESSGAGVITTSTIKLELSFTKEDLFGSSSKKRQKKNSKSGRNSRESK